jgi:hypothetical protein
MEPSMIFNIVFVLIVLGILWLLLRRQRYGDDSPDIFAYGQLLLQAES